MHEELPARARGLTDANLLRDIARLATSEREATVELVGHLAEFDARKLHVAEGYGSLFAYCTGPLRFGEHAAYNRIEAARLSRRFPVVLDLLADGSLNLSTLRLLAPHLQADNFETLVGRARHRTKREVEAVGAELAPQPDVAASVRKLPERKAISAAAQKPSLSGARSANPSEPSIAAASTSEPEGSSRSESNRFATLAAKPLKITAAAAPPTERPVVAPLSPGRYRMQFTMTAPTQEKLRQAQDLLRREIPDGDPDAIIGKALALLLEDIARRKLASTRKPRPGHARSTGSRHVPPRVKRAVWLRDRAQCAFVSARGRRCTERAFLEFHHREPYAIGGEATTANISLRCRAHNSYEAALVFGSGGPGSSFRRRNSSREPGSAIPPIETLNSPRGEFHAAVQSSS